MSDVVDYRLYVGSDFDDHGWDPHEFRMLGRIYRRCGGKKGFFTGRCWDSIPSLSRSLGMSQPVVRRTLKILEAAGAIASETRPGETTQYSVLDRSKWEPSERLPEIRKRFTPAKNDRGAKNDRPAKKSTEGLPKATGEPLSKPADKGIPSEGIPSEGIPKAPAAVAASDVDPVETRIWKDGIDLLAKSGMSEKQSRPFLGGMAKDYGRDAVAQAIAATQGVNSPDPKAYMVGVLRRSQKQDKAAVYVGKADDACIESREYACRTCFDTGRAVRAARDGEPNVGGVVMDECQDCAA